MTIKKVKNDTNLSVKYICPMTLTRQRNSQKKNFMAYGPWLFIDS